MRLMCCACQAPPPPPPTYRIVLGLIEISVECDVGDAGKEVLTKDVCLVKFSWCLKISGCPTVAKGEPDNNELVPKNDEQLPNNKNQCLIMTNLGLKITKQG